MLSIVLGEKTARTMLDAHENIDGEGRLVGSFEPARKMDLINNEIGVRVGREVFAAFLELDHGLDDSRDLAGGQLYDEDFAFGASTQLERMLISAIEAELGPSGSALWLITG